MTQRYDFYGNPINPPRRRSGPRSAVWGLVACAALIVACIFLTWAMHHAKTKEEAKQQEATEQRPKGPTHDSMTVTYTYDGEAIRYYVMTDPDTQRQYIVNDRGGMCLREPHETSESKVVRHDDGSVTYRDSEEVTE